MKKYHIIVFLLVAITLFQSGCGQKSEEPKAPAEAPAPTAAPAAPAAPGGIPARTGAPASPEQTQKRYLAKKAKPSSHSRTKEDEREFAGGSPFSFPSMSKGAFKKDLPPTTERTEVAPHVSRTPHIVAPEVAMPPPAAPPPPVGLTGMTSYPLGALAADRPVESFQKLPGVVWNAWAEETQSANVASKPVTSLKPNTTYLLAIDFSAIPYPGIMPKTVSATLRTKVSQWIKNPTFVANLKVLLLLPPHYFETDRTRVITVDRMKSKNVADLRVEAKRILQMQESVVLPEGDAFQVMAEKIANGETELPNFVYGRAKFQIHTANVKVASSGTTTVIGLSLWFDDRPVDEITIPMCILPEGAKPEKCSSGEEGTFATTDSFFLASESSSSPDASLHVVELDKNVMGVFRDKQWEPEKFSVWSYHSSAGHFRQQLIDDHLTYLSKASDEESLINRGNALFEYFFPDDTQDGKDARTEFLKFVEPQLRKDRFTNKTKSIFIRMIQQGPDPPLIIPLGLMAVPIDNKYEFLGYHLRMEAPLEIQTYQESSECISRWVLVLPPAGDAKLDDTIQAALAEADPLISKWKDHGQDKVKFIRKMRELVSWIKTGEERDKDYGAALALLSHHDKDALSFYAAGVLGDDPLVPSQVKPMFGKPSVAILNGCGTGGPEGSEMLRHFNQSGFGTIIAASTEVKGPMAGALFPILANKLEENKDNPSYTIAHAYFDTLQQLSGQQPKSKNGITLKPYGPFVLQFALLGNGNLRVCPPKK